VQPNALSAYAVFVSLAFFIFWDAGELLARLGVRELGRRCLISQQERSNRNNGAASRLLVFSLSLFLDAPGRPVKDGIDCHLLVYAYQL
jgi:hypothetical protein